MVFQAAALVLSYPEPELLDRLDMIETALIGSPAVEQFAPVISHLRGGTIPEPVEAIPEHPATTPEPVEGSSQGFDTSTELSASKLSQRPQETSRGFDTSTEFSRRLSELQSFHVQEFDLSRKHALHLSYWTDGDTRRRGQVLAEIKQVYRDSGLVVDLGGELPDYLPIVLEFAVADPERGRELLQRFRASVELIRLGLTADRLPHAGVLAAICDLLPGPSPKNRAEVQAMFGEIQPVELVGLGLPSLVGVSTSSTNENTRRSVNDHPRRSVNDHPRRSVNDQSTSSTNDHSTGSTSDFETRS